MTTSLRYLLEKNAIREYTFSDILMWLVFIAGLLVLFSSLASVFSFHIFPGERFVQSFVRDSVP